MMDAIEKRAREILDLYADPIPVAVEDGRWFMVREQDALDAVRAALTRAEGHVVVIRNEAGQAVAVTRQDEEGRILSVIAELEMPSGYMLVPVGQDPVDFYVCDACGHHYMEDGVTCDCTPDAVQPPLRHVCMISARPEVP